MNQHTPSANALQGILFDAINRGDATKVSQLLGAFTSEDLNEINNDYGHTFLTQACALGNVEISMMLVEAGADVNTIDQMGDYPLGNAAWSGYVDLTQALLDCGANPDLDLSKNPEAIPLDEWVKADHPCYGQINHKRAYMASEQRKDKLMNLPQTKGRKKTPQGPVKM